MLRLHAVVLFLACALCKFLWAADPGSTGHALLFHNDIVLKTDFNNFPSTQLTFEAWLSINDYCHSGTILSYALNSRSNDEIQRIRDFNHFVIFDPKNLIACHDYQYIDLYPDFLHQSCHAAYNNTITTSFVERENMWHHLAVTWDGEKNGNTKIYQDGMLVAEAMKTSTRPLQPDGALMLGAEQDCYAGCTDSHQGYYGLMDEIRIWKTVRTQSEIMQNMRVSGGFVSDDLVAYWQFNDPDQDPENPMSYVVAKDSSKYKNDLLLRSAPSSTNVVIKNENNEELETYALSFHNNYAIQPEFATMPQEDFTIEFWARTEELDDKSYSARESAQFSEFLSFATVSQGDGIVGNDQGQADSSFIDDAIRIERYLSEFKGSPYLSNARVSTQGAISVHVNANRQGNGKQFDNWIDFSTGWVDGKWHHIAVTWEYRTGDTRLYFDGKPITPFWVSDGGKVDDQDPQNGGVISHIGKRVRRSAKGSLVLGQNQECYGGCFSPTKSFDGSIAVLRIWNRVLNERTINENMMVETPSNTQGLTNAYFFGTSGQAGVSTNVADEVGGQTLLLGSDGPSWEISDAPLADRAGNPLLPMQSVQGHALRLHDEVVLMHSNFQNFPSTAVTLEFWMKSVDNCRMGVPFSYAAGQYQTLDNGFLVFNYNDWGISVMEDEGSILDHTSGISSTDGKWHYVAVTWSSETGEARLYQDGRLAWLVERGRGEVIPSGGTLVIGREQDCVGGCFDSASGAAGRVEEGDDLQYGSQDFFGEIDEMRLWNKVLTSDQIHQNWKNDQILYAEDTSKFNKPAVRTVQGGLVAYWTFDEGQGYTVFDISGNGHDLRILEEPEWVVVGYEASKRSANICGNGEIELLEECDDGNTVSGDGCSSTCKVEPGYICAPIGTSFCYQPGSNNTDAMFKRNLIRQEQILQHVGQSSSLARSQNINSSNNSHSKSHVTTTVLIVIAVVLAVLATLAGILYVKREWVYDHFPGVDNAVKGLQDKYRGLGSKRFDYHQYDVVAWDPEQSTPLKGGASASTDAPYSKLAGEEIIADDLKNESSK